MSKTTNQPPIEEFRAGSVKAAIWKNELQRDNQTVIQHSVTITRSYKDKEGIWQETDSYFTRDMLDLITVTEAAYRFIRLRQRSENEDNRETVEAGDNIPI